MLLKVIIKLKKLVLQQMLNAKFRHPLHLLGVVGVGATETRATARLPGTGRASSGCDHPGEDRGDRGAEAENNQTLIKQLLAGC